MTIAKKHVFETDNEKYEYLSAVRRADSDFRNQVRVRVRELMTDAGKKALDFLLDPSKSVLEQEARTLHARGSAIEGALERFNGASRHYVDATTIAGALCEILNSLESLRDYQQEEAQDHALVTVTNPTKAEQSGSSRLAFNAHQRAAGTAEFCDMMRKAFTPLCFEEKVPAEAPAA